MIFVYVLIGLAITLGIVSVVLNLLSERMTRKYIAKANESQKKAGESIDKASEALDRAQALLDEMKE